MNATTLNEWKADRLWPQLCVRFVHRYPAKRVGKHWVPLTDKTKKKITFGLRRLYKNTYLKISKRKGKQEEDPGAKPVDSDDYDIYELFTCVFSTLIFPLSLPFDE